MVPVGFVTFVGLYLSIGPGALSPLSARMSIFQCLRTLVAEPNRLGNRPILGQCDNARRTLSLKGNRDALPNQITMKATGPSEAAIATIAAAAANERKEDPNSEDWRYMEASFNLYLFESYFPLP